MPFQTVDELKQSALFKRSDTLKAFSSRQLQRFVDIFNAAYARVKERGGAEEQAESTGLAIALSAAKRANASLGRTLEPEVHFFAAMAPQQLGGGEDGIQGRVLDFAWIAENPDLASIAVEGNEFNFEHDRAHTALGQIRGIILSAGAPQEVREKVHQDIPFLYVASYYNDVDPELKALDTISAEWAALGEKDGIEIPLPLSFAVTRTPLNGPENGIQRIASLKLTEDAISTLMQSANHETVKKGGLPFKYPRGTMPKTPEEQIKELQAALEAAQKSAEDVKALKETFASLQATAGKLKGLEPLAEAFASLGDNKAGSDPKDALKTIEAGLKQVQADLVEKAKLADRVAALEKERDEKNANEFAAGLVKEGKVPSTEVEKWAGLHLKDPTLAKELAAGLPSVLLGEEEATRARSAGLPKEARARQELLASLDPRMAKKKEGDA